MDENNENMVEGGEQQPSQKRGMKDRLSSAYDKYQGYNDLKNQYNANGLGGVAKGMAKDAINKKVDQVKDKAKTKINDKKDAIKNKAKDKIDSKLPDSVKNKRDELKNKGQNLKNKLNAPKDKMNKMKDNLDKKKRDLNKKTFKKSVGAMANAVAPGSGTAAEKILDSPLGKEPMEAAENAATPVGAVKEGFKKLVNIVVSREIKKKLLITLLPTGIFIFVAIMLILLYINNFADIIVNIFNLDAVFEITEKDDNTGNDDLADANNISNVEIQKFFNKVAKYSDGADRYMIVAALTAYKSKDDYLKDDSVVVESCTDTEVQNGQCFSETKDGATIYTKSKIQSYIVKVANAIKESNGDISEGDYDDPENTGSEFFKWMYNDFLEDYYDEMFSDSSALKEKSTKLRYLYLYYKDLKSMGGTSGIYTVTNLCTNGITIEGDKTYSLDEYVAGVVEAENNWYQGDNINAMKAQAIAARTYVLMYTDNCSKTIPNSTTAQTYKTPSEKSLQAARETSSIVLTYNGEMFLSEYDGFYGTCSGDNCTANYEKIPNKEKHTINVPIAYVPSYARDYFGHGRGMSQYGSRYLQAQGMDYNEILKYYYSSGVEVATAATPSVGDLYYFGAPNGILSAILFPISKNDISKVYMSAGWRYSSGKYHGAIDIASTEGGMASHSIPIYAAYDGKITYYQNSNCNSYSASAAAKTGLSYVSGCKGKQLIITVQSGDYKNYKFSYAHFSNLAEGITDGATVKAGQLLGYMGNTGNSSGPHLHFRISDSNGNHIYMDNVAKSFFSTYQ